MQSRGCAGSASGVGCDAEEAVPATAPLVGLRQVLSGQVITVLKLQYGAGGGQCDTG